MITRDVYSAFYYGHTITSGNFTIDFDEGGGEFQASLDIGDYTLSTLIQAVKNQLDATGTQEYTVTVDRVTRIVTISASANFDLLVTTGSRAGTSVYGLLGFISDQTGSNSYSGSQASGEAFFPQFWLQDYISTSDWNEGIDPSVSVASSGVVEVVKFGTQSFMQCNFKYNTNLSTPAFGPFINNPNGLDDLRDFMNFAIDKKGIEFMEDRDNPQVFERMILERTPDSQQGTGYKLKENRTAAGFFDTGVLKFRKVN